MDNIVKLFNEWIYLLFLSTISCLFKREILKILEYQFMVYWKTKLLFFAFNKTVFLYNNDVVNYCRSEPLLDIAKIGGKQGKDQYSIWIRVEIAILWCSDYKYLLKLKVGNKACSVSTMKQNTNSKTCLYLLQASKTFSGL